jgi:hypothetical protein
VNAGEEVSSTDVETAYLGLGGLAASPDLGIALALETEPNTFLPPTSPASAMVAVLLHSITAIINVLMANGRKQ